MTAARPSEHHEAVALMQIVAMHEGRWPELKMLFAVPNGGARHPAVAAKLKSEGVKPGVPDYLMPVKNEQYAGLAIELKIKGNRPTKTQIEWHRALASQGWHVVVAYGAQEAWDAIRGYLRG